MTITTTNPTTSTGNLIRCAAAEAIGTFFLVLAGSGTAAGSALFRSPGSLGVASVFGFVWLAAALSLGLLSGGHFNPAVTLAMWLAKHFPLKGALYYWTAQFGASVVAALCIWGMLGDRARSGSVALGVTLPQTAFGATLSQVALGEFCFSFLLCIAPVVIVEIASRSFPKAPAWLPGVAASAALFVGVLVLAPISGGSLNPARYFGPALVSLTTGGWGSFLVYMSMPMVAGAAAASVVRVIRNASVPTL